MGGIYKNLYQDWLQLFLLAVCLFDLVFFSYYLFTYELAAQNTISDSLFQHAEYLIILTVTLSVRSLGVCLYLMRYRNEASGWVIAGFAGLFVTLFGWYVLRGGGLTHQIYPTSSQNSPSKYPRSTVT